MDPSQPTTVIRQVGIITGCEKDGDKTCRVDLGVKATSSNQETASVIGSEDKPSVTVSVSNKGEPAFLPSVTVRADPPLALLLPSTHSCDFPSADRSSCMSSQEPNYAWREVHVPEFYILLVLPWHFHVTVNYKGESLEIHTNTPPKIITSTNP
ncbi:uncharacterized protein LOC119598049 [Penaeus monodon]|uniref:uncharacterized protein LOC119598049 n=1 Tax=Penaeus monodon TaxID=6687 RepID=UPI0018A7902A|nr:uncharacterized protein LOC119598049 [Penaeus monodon]